MTKLKLGMGVVIVVAVLGLSGVGKPQPQDQDVEAKEGTLVGPAVGAWMMQMRRFHPDKKNADAFAEGLDSLVRSPEQTRIYLANTTGYKQDAHLDAILVAQNARLIEQNYEIIGMLKKIAEK